MSKPGITSADDAVKRAVADVGKPSDDPAVLKFRAATGKYYFADDPTKEYTAIELAQVMSKVSANGNGNGNGKGRHYLDASPETKAVIQKYASKSSKHSDKGEPPALPKPKKFGKGKPPAVYYPSSEETIDLHVSTVMPNSDKLLFIDPKAMELTSRAAPRMKFLVEHMATVPPKKSIDPRLLMGIGVMFVIVVIGLVILYNSWIKPAQEAELNYQREIIRNGGNATGIAKPNGGGLFNFGEWQPPNPFTKCPTCT